MRKTIGILAHVDGGKTTFSEELLHQMGVIRTPGRVDRKNTLLDFETIEKERGITVFSGQSSFTYKNDTYYLMDTPGHVDFSAETERAVMALDYAVILVDAGSGVTAHTVTLFKLLERYHIPAFFFLNKMDLETAEEEELLEEIRSRLTKDVLPVNQLSDDNVAEFAAERDEELLEKYLDGRAEEEMVKKTLISLIRERQAFVCMKGSALKKEGIKEFFQVFHELTVTEYEEKEDQPFSALVYKIRHDNKKNRITFLKVLEGRLKVKEEAAENEKINEIRIYSGDKYTAVSEAAAGEVCAVTGVFSFGSGNFLGNRKTEKPVESVLMPSLEAVAEAADGTDSHTLLGALKVLEAEDDKLQVQVREMEEGAGEQICISVMGAIQLEVLQQVLRERFQIEVRLSSPRVLYKETIKAPVMGYGHYEPLRHYAEANLLLEPAKRGEGILFDSSCHVDTLAANYQSLIKTHVFERVHKGILTGSPLTDVKITLTDGRAHLKHTEGGDFREAVYRAIRQGLEKADNLLLEPWYRFEIMADQDYMGRILSDIQKRAGEFDPPEQSGKDVVIRGKGPVSTFMDYSAELASFTKGSATISLISAGYEECHNPEEVIAEKAYDKGSDKAHTSSSVFCSHGAGFVVNWDEAENYMHCLKK